MGRSFWHAVAPTEGSPDWTPIQRKRVSIKRCDAGCTRRTERGEDEFAGLAGAP